jgi:hypothetical protein
MNVQRLVLQWTLLGAALTLSICTAFTAEPDECVQLEINDPAGARFTNICNEMMNVMYCVDSPTSPKTCSAERLGITTLVPLSFEIVPDYAGEGKGAIYSAICAYPTAPVGWKPGPDNPFTCKKTCVMC